MTPQEQQMLQGLVQRVNQAPLQDKDGEAEDFIQQTLGKNPDALYIMAQTILVQQYALDQAQKQLADLRAQMQSRPPQEQKHGSFLGNLLGMRDDPQPRQAPPPPPPPPQQMPMQAQYGAPMYAPSGGYPLPGQPQGGGFLRGAMQTAAGVAAGALAFEGIESLMHGFGHGGGYGGYGESGRPEEVINNYYGDSAQHEHASSGNDKFYDPSSDASRSDSTSASHDSSSDISSSGSQQQDFYGGNDTTTNADDVSGTAGSDYSSDQDDSMLSDDVGGQDDGGYDSGGDDSGGDFDSGGGGGDDSSF